MALFRPHLVLFGIALVFLTANGTEGLKCYVCISESVAPPGMKDREPVSEKCTHNPGEEFLKDYASIPGHINITEVGEENLFCQKSVGPGKNGGVLMYRGFAILNGTALKIRGFRDGVYDCITTERNVTGCYCQADACNKAGMHYSSMVMLLTGFIAAIM